LSSLTLIIDATHKATDTKEHVLDGQEIKKWVSQICFFHVTNAR